MSSILISEKFAVAQTETDPIDEAIDLALQYLDRMYYEINSTHAVCLDLPGLTFRLHRSDGKWIIVGKKTANGNYENNPVWNAPPGTKGADVIAGGTLADLIQPGGKIGEPEIYLYKFDGKGDQSYSIHLKVWYTAINETCMKLEGEIVQCDGGDYGYDLYIDDDLLIQDIQVGKTFTRMKNYGWTLKRYVCRHVTKGLANLYKYIGENLGENGVYKGINYTERAQKLYNTWYGSGYTWDINDALYFASNDERPDYPEEGHSWVVSKGTYRCPEVWTNLPILMNETEVLFPYRSRLGYGFARDVWLYGVGPLAFYPSSGGDYPTVQMGYFTIFGWSAQAKLCWALHLLNKYGTQEPYLSQAKAYIDQIEWNGIGVAYEKEPPLLRFKVPVYGTHVTTLYAAALIRYYQLTGDEWYAERADEVVGVLLQLQQKPGMTRMVGEYNSKEVYRPDHIGGVMPGYRWGGGVEFYDCMAHWPIYKWIYGTLDWIWYTTGGWKGYSEDPCAYPSVALSNTEATVPAVMVWLLYKQLGRTPILPEADLVFPFTNAEVHTAHGGSYGGDGDIHRADKYGQFEVYVWGGLGEGWAEVTYSWHITTTKTLRDVNFKIIFASYYDGLTMAGNSLTLYVEVYINEDFLIASHKEILLDGVDTHISGTQFQYWALGNLCRIDTLPPDQYKIQLRFYAHAGFDSGIFIGWWPEPAKVVFFGMDYQDPTETFEQPKYKLRVTGDGDDGNSKLRVYFEDYDFEFNLLSSDVSVIPYEEQGVTFEVLEVSSGYYFWYWHVENVRLGISENITSNPMYLWLDHDYNVTACFGTSPVPPSELVTLELYVKLHYTDTVINEEGYYERIQIDNVPKPQIRHYNGSEWIEGEGKWKYPQGTVISVETSAPEGYLLHLIWTPEGPIYSSTLQVNLTSDFIAKAVYVAPYTSLKFVDSSTGDLIRKVYVKYQQTTWLTDGNVKIVGKHQPYTIEVYAPQYYSKKVTITPDATSPEITVELNPIVYGGVSFPCPRLIVAGKDLGIIDIHASKDVIKNIQLDKELLSNAVEEGMVKITLIEGYPGLTMSESYIDYVTLNGNPPAKAYLNGEDVTELIEASDDIRLYMKLNDRLDIYFNYTEAVDSVFMIEGHNRLKMSKLVTFYATIPWSNLTENFYVDSNRIIYCEPVFNETAKIKIVVHYNTYYPIVELHAENVAYIRFDIERLYEVYCKENLDTKIERTSFLGFLVETNQPLVVEVTGLRSKPNEIWKRMPSGEEYRFEDWDWPAQGVLILNFMPGDPTVSLIWGSPIDTMNNLILQLAIIIIALTCLAAIFKIARRYIE